jgi:hypothetical protein
MDKPAPRLGTELASGAAWVPLPVRPEIVDGTTRHANFQFK